MDKYDSLYLAASLKGDNRSGCTYAYRLYQREVKLMGAFVRPLSLVSMHTRTIRVVLSHSVYHLSPHNFEFWNCDSPLVLAKKYHQLTLLANRCCSQSNAFDFSMLSCCSSKMVESFFLIIASRSLTHPSRTVISFRSSCMSMGEHQGTLPSYVPLLLTLACEDSSGSIQSRQCGKTQCIYPP